MNEQLRKHDLLDALELLRREGWVQCYGRTKDGICATEACRAAVTRAAGPIDLVVHSWARSRYWATMEALTVAIPGQAEAIKARSRIECVEYNDAPGRTFAEIEAWFLRATQVRT